MALPGGGLIRLARRAGEVEGGPSTDDLFAALPMPVLVVDGSGAVRRANAAAELFVNASQPAMIGRPIGRVIGLEPDHPVVAAATADAPFAAYDIDVAPMGGRRQRVDLSLAPLPDHSGWSVMTLRSRTALSGSRHGGTRTAIGAAAMLAHEIKNPLSGIRGAAQLLEDGDEAGLTRLIRDEVDRIAKLIDRMEGFTDTRPLERSAQNIHAILGHVREVAARGFAEGIAIREVYDPSLPAVLGHRDALIQIFINLLKNAAEVIDSSGAERVITVTTAYRHGVSVAAGRSSQRVSLPIEVRVVDHGPGAPADLVDNLFDPFVTTKRTGSGLGLALVDKLVADQGGIVEYAREAEPARTVFRVLLPRAPGSAE